MKQIRPLSPGPERIFAIEKHGEECFLARNYRVSTPQPQRAASASSPLRIRGGSSTNISRQMRITDKITQQEPNRLHFRLESADSKGNGNSENTTCKQPIKSIVVAKKSLKYLNSLQLCDSKPKKTSGSKQLFRRFRGEMGYYPEMAPEVLEGRASPSGFLIVDTPALAESSPLANAARIRTVSSSGQFRPLSLLLKAGMERSTRPACHGIVSTTSPTTEGISTSTIKPRVIGRTHRGLDGSDSATDSKQKINMSFKERYYLDGMANLILGEGLRTDAANLALRGNIQKSLMLTRSMIGSYEVNQFLRKRLEQPNHNPISASKLCHLSQ
jgi:hypothetical protein